MLAMRTGAADRPHRRSTTRTPSGRRASKLPDRRSRAARSPSGSGSRSASRTSSPPAPTGGPRRRSPPRAIMGRIAALLDPRHRGVYADAIRTERPARTLSGGCTRRRDRRTCANIGSAMGMVAGSPNRQPHRLLLRRPRGHRQGQGVGRRRQGHAHAGPGRPQRGRDPRPRRSSACTAWTPSTTSTRVRRSSSAPTASSPRSSSARRPRPGRHRRHLHLGDPGAAPAPAARRRGLHHRPPRHAPAPRGRRPARLRPGRDRGGRGGGLGTASRAASGWPSSPSPPSRPGSSRSWPRSWSSRAHELKIVNTVCPVTIRRQEDTLETAREVDLMVVVGGRHSANTKELTRLCQIAGTPAVQIENAPDLDGPGPVRRRPRRRRDRRHVHPGRGPARGRASGSSSSPAPTSCARAPPSSPHAALEAAATPAGRTTSLPRTDRRRPAGRAPWLARAVAVAA